MLNIRKTNFSGKQFILIIIFCAAFLPTLIIGWLVAQYGVDMPYYDQWATPGIIFEKIHDGTLSFKDFVAQHNESRKLFPRLFFVALAYLTNWNTRYEFAAIILVACAVSVSVYKLSRITLNINRLTALALLIPVNMLIFSPAQWENWLWGIQIIVFVPILCILLCLIISYSNLSPLVKAVLCAALSTLSTYSYANGMLCWVLAAAALLLSDLEKRSSIRKISAWFLPYSIAFLFIIATYFYDYSKPVKHPSFSEAIFHPIHALTYFLAFLGSPLSGGNLPNAVAAGAFITIIFSSSLLYCLTLNRSSQLLRSSRAWIIVGFYSLFSALITTLGRVGFGVEQSLSPRYTTFSIYLTIASIYLLTAIILDLKRQDFRPALYQFANGVDTKILATSLLSCVMTVIVTLHFLAFSNAVQAMQISMRERLYLKACLHYVNFSDDVCKLKIFPDIAKLEQRADAINAMGFLKPKLAESSIVKQGKIPEGSPKNENGWFDRFLQTAPNQYSGEGWATLPDQKRSADAVLLTYKTLDSSEEDDTNWRIFAVAPIQIERKDVADFFSQPSYKISGWESSFSTKDLPEGRLRLRAWAYNSETGEAFRLRRIHTIRN